MVEGSRARPPPVLVTRATILQSNHEFPRALADLDKAIAREPGNARAHPRPRDRPDRSGASTMKARADCKNLQGTGTGDTYVLGCIASIDAVTGKAKVRRSARARGSLAACRTHRPTCARGSSRCSERSRSGSGDPAAEGHFRAALAADPRDLYTIGAYCDWLLEQNRAAEVIPLVENEQRVDALLLRLALAQNALRPARSRDRQWRRCERASTRAGRGATPCIGARKRASSWSSTAIRRRRSACAQRKLGSPARAGGSAHSGRGRACDRRCSGADDGPRNGLPRPARIPGRGQHW